MTRVWRHPEWHVPAGQLVLRGAVMLAAFCTLVGAAAVGSVPTWLALTVALLSLVAVARPDSAAGLALVIALGIAWLLQPSDAVTSPWVLLAALGVVTTHVGLLVAAQGPAVMRPDHDQVLRWSSRGAGLWLVCAALWLVAHGVHRIAAPSAVLLAVLVGLTGTAASAGQRIRQGPST